VNASSGIVPRLKRWIKRHSAVPKAGTGFWGADSMPSKEKIEKVLRFFMEYPDFRLLEACARETGMDIATCSRIKEYLYQSRQLGGYFFEADAPPHRYMRRHILRHYSWISKETRILEVGPGAHPVFPLREYSNWYAVDKYVVEGIIRFKEKVWDHDLPVANRILKGRWEELSRLFENSGIVFDLIVGSHSYEHVFQPIQAIIEARRILRPGGVLANFVPDGYSDEPAARMEMTHSLYLVPDMIREFFHCAGGFKNLVIEPFRPNYDLFFSAEKE